MDIGYQTALLADRVSIAENKIGVNDRECGKILQVYRRPEERANTTGKEEIQRRANNRLVTHTISQKSACPLRTPKHSNFQPRSGDQLWRRRYTTVSFPRHYSDLPMFRCFTVWRNEKSLNRPKINYTKLQAITRNCSLDSYNVSLNCWSQLRLKRTREPCNNLHFLPSATCWRQKRVRVESVSVRSVG